MGRGAVGCLVDGLALDALDSPPIPSGTQDFPLQIPKQAEPESGLTLQGSFLLLVCSSLPLHPQLSKAPSYSLPWHKAHISPSHTKQLCVQQGYSQCHVRSFGLRIYITNVTKQKLSWSELRSIQFFPNHNPSMHLVCFTDMYKEKKYWAYF